MITSEENNILVRELRPGMIMLIDDCLNYRCIYFIVSVGERPRNGDRHGRLMNVTFMCVGTKGKMHMYNFDYHPEVVFITEAVRLA